MGKYLQTGEKHQIWCETSLDHCEKISMRRHFLSDLWRSRSRSKGQNIHILFFGFFHYHFSSSFHSQCTFYSRPMFWCGNIWLNIRIYIKMYCWYRCKMRTFKYTSVSALKTQRSCPKFLDSFLKPQVDGRELYTCIECAINAPYTESYELRAMAALHSVRYAFVAIS